MALQEQCIETGTPWDKNLLLDADYSKKWQLEISEEPDVEILKEAFINHKAIAVSDGSFKNGWGAVAWTIKGGDTAGRMVGMSFTPGTGNDQSAFRSKLAGIYGIVFTISHLMKAWELADMSILIACDGKLAVDCLNSTKPIQA